MQMGSLGPHFFDNNYITAIKLRKDCHNFAKTCAMKSLILITIVSISTLAFARSPTQGGYLESADQWKQSTIPNTAAFLNLFAEVKSEIDDLIVPLKPARVKPLLNKQFKYSQFNGKTDELVLGLFNGKSLGLEDRVTLAHEYGHAIFKRYYPSSDKYYDGGVRSSFHELFADVVAITYTQDLEAISDYVTVKPAFLGRKFSIDGDRYYKNWVHFFSADDRIKDSYAIMNPIRWAFGDIVRDKMHSENYRRKMIPVFFEVIHPYILGALAQLKNEHESIGPKEMIQINEKIIQDLYESDLRNL